MFHVKQNRISLEAILQASGWTDLKKIKDAKERLQQYVALLEKWNQAMNLVSQQTLEDAWQRHILDSVQLLPFIVGSTSGQKSVVDLGSGAGFPGLVLAILEVGPVILIESNARKCRFLEEVAAATGTEVEICNARIEQVQPKAADCVVSRAMAVLKDLLAYSYPFCSPASECLFLKTDAVEKEVVEAQNSWGFEYEIYQSKTSCHGRVIRVKHIRKV